MAKKPEQAIMGPEPIFPDPIHDPRDVRLVHAFSWYNYFYTYDDFKKFVLEYMKKSNWCESSIEVFEKADVLVYGHMGAKARMITKGVKMPPEIVSQLNAYISDVCMTARAQALEHVDTNYETRPAIVKKMIAEIDYVIDQFLFKYKFFEPQIYDLLTSNNVKPTHAKKLREYYTPLLDEIQAGLSSEIEGYEHLSKKQKKDYLKFIESILGDIDRITHNAKATRVRKPRKKKAKSADQLTKSVKYMKEFPELKIVSVNPADIVGAQSLWLYNTKYRRLTWLVANSGALAVKGTTVVGFDEKLSVTKTTRKPEVAIEKVLSGTKRSLNRVMDDLKTKGITPNGRINKETIILRAIK